MTKRASQQHRFRWLHKAFVPVVLVSLICFFLAQKPYRQIELLRGLSAAEVSEISVTPNGDQAAVRIDRPDEIEAFVSWLYTADVPTNLQSAPPKAIFDGFVHFRDGRTETFKTSAVLPLLHEYPNLNSNTRWERKLIEPRSEVRIHFRGFVRHGNQSKLAGILVRSQNQDGG